MRSFIMKSGGLSLLGLLVVGVLFGGCRRAPLRQETPGGTDPSAVRTTTGSGVDAAAPNVLDGSSSPRASAEKLKIQLEPSPRLVLGGRFKARLPSNAPPPYAYKNQEPSEQPARAEFNPFDVQEHTLSIVFFDTLRRAGPDLAGQARGYLAKRPVPREGPAPQFEVRELTGLRPPLRGVLAIPDGNAYSEAADDLLELGENDPGGRFLAVEALIAQPDGMVSALDVLCSEDFCPRDQLAELTQQIAVTLEPGSTPLFQGAGPRIIGPFRFEFPAGFVASSYDGSDYTNTTITRVVALDAEPSDSLSIFSAASIPPLWDPLLPPRLVKARLLGRPIHLREWRSDDSTSVSLSHDCILSEVLHTLTIHSMTQGGLDELSRIMASAQIVPNDYVSATDRCVPFECTSRRYEYVFVRDPNPPLNVRSGPNAQSPVVGTLQNGDEVELAERSGSWVHLRSPTDGWAWAGSLLGVCARE